MRKNKHGYIGVYARNDGSRTNIFRARIRVGDATIESPACASDIEAAQAFDALAIRHRGASARLNFPEVCA